MSRAGYATTRIRELRDSGYEHIERIFVVRALSLRLRGEPAR